MTINKTQLIARLGLSTAGSKTSLEIVQVCKIYKTEEHKN